MSDDLISRSALLERMEKVLFATVPVEHQLYVQMAIDAFKAVAENAPAVDAEPVRHGRWILKAHDKRVNYLWTVTAYCSECCDEETEIWSGHFPGVPDMMAQDIALDSAKTVKLSYYCPNCGAKMDAEVER